MVEHPAHRSIALRTFAHSQRMRAHRSHAATLVSASKGLQRSVFDAEGTTTLPGRLVRSEGEAPVSDLDVNAAYDNAGKVYAFFKSVFGRDSIDGRGIALDATVHYDVQYNDVYWDGAEMVYGDGDGAVFHNFVRTLDVVAHEVMHGVTQTDAALDYYGQSGSLSEHIADVFGSLVKQYSASPQPLAVEADWLIGEGVLIGARAMRSMEHPGTAYRDHPVLGNDPQPADMAHMYHGHLDGAGTHLNCGIPSRAFVLFAKSLGAYAWETAGSIWYRVVASHAIGPACRFETFKHATLKEAARSARAAVPALEAAWAAVGL